MSGAGMRLDPTAEEFWPSAAAAAVPRPGPDHFQVVQPPIYFPYPSPGMLAPPPGPPGPPMPELSVAPAVCAGATRAVVLNPVPGHVTEAAVWRDMEAFGAVRAVHVVERRASPSSSPAAAGADVEEMAVVVQFYDVRDAQQAVVEVQAQHMRQQSRLGHHYSLLMRNWCPPEELLLGFPPPPPLAGPAVQERGLVDGRAVWAQFTTATPVGGVEGQNQGTIVVFNVDPDIPSDHLSDIFQVFGAVKEVREAPSKRPHRFIEFFDVRDAARALAQMDGKCLYGKRLLIQFSRAGGQSKRLVAAAAAACTIPSSSSSTSFLPNHRSLTSKGSRRDHDKSSKKVTGVAAAEQQPATPRSRKCLKSAGKVKKPDLNFVFGDEFDAAECRTTVMIKNIPNKYSQKLLLNMLDNHCINSNEQIAQVGEEEEPISAFDFVYLPIDFNNKCNVGYGFVNLTSPQAAWRLYKAFHKQPWEVFNSRKICEVSYARLQGLEALREHFKNSKFACDTDEYLPVVFSPPRDGKQLTDPLAVGGHQSGDEAAEAGRKKPVDDDDDESSSSTSTSTSEGGGADDRGGEGEEALRARMSEVAVSPASGSAAGNGCLSVAGLSGAAAPAQAFSF